MTGTSSGRQGADDSVVTALPGPLVPIDTMANVNGQWGVLVGPRNGVNQFYADPGNSKEWLQLLVLNAETLEKVSNKSYPCPQATDHPYVNQGSAVQDCVNALTGDLSALKNSGQRLVVIAVSQRPDGPIQTTGAWAQQPPVGAVESLLSIGVPPPNWINPQTPLLRGRFSAIGYMGGVAQGATFHINRDLNDYRDDGEIRGFLLRDNKSKLSPKLDDEYSTYASPEHLPFDTQAPGSNQYTSVIRVGNNAYTEQNPGQSPLIGFHVVILERQGLGGGSYFFNTNSFDNTPQVLTNMAQKIPDAAATSNGHGALVFISGVNGSVNGAVSGPYEDQLNDAAKSLVDELTTHVGATRTRLYDFLNGDSRYYSLAAEYGTPIGQGVEAEGNSRTGVPPGMNTVPLVGSLTRSATDYGFEFEPSQVGDELGGPGLKLRQWLFKDPGPWPEQSAGGCKAFAGQSDPSSLDNDGCRAAIEYISGKTSIGTQRELFWSTAYTDADWTARSNDIAKLSYPGTTAGSAADFKWAQNELMDEIGWLKLVHAFVDKLAKPFATNQVSAWSDLSGIATKIDNDTTVTNADDTTAEKAWLVFDAVRTFAEVALQENPLTAIPTETANIVYDIVSGWAKVDAHGTEVDDPFPVATSQAGKELGDRLQDAQDTLQNQMADAIASDYQKLRAVALCEELNSNCPDPPLSEWKITPQDQNHWAAGINAGSHVALYSALLPAKYRGWAPDLSPYRSMHWYGHQPAGQDIFAWHCPFHDLPDTGSFAYPVKLDVAQSGRASDWKVIAYAHRDGQGTVAKPYEMVLPTKDVTDPLFKSPDDGGYGAFPESFYWDSFGDGKTFPFSHSTGTTNESPYGFPLQDSQVRWITKDDPPGFKAPSCGYG